MYEPYACTCGVYLKYHPMQFRHFIPFSCLIICMLVNTSWVSVQDIGTAEYRTRAVQWMNEQSYDFETVELGTTVGAVFSFKNITDHPIQLQTIRTTCGCTAAKCPETPVAPGEIADIHIEFTAENSGGFEKKIRVFFDAMRKPEILKIYGVVN